MYTYLKAGRENITKTNTVYSLNENFYPQQSHLETRMSRMRKLVNFLNDKGTSHFELLYSRLRPICCKRFEY